MYILIELVSEADGSGLVFICILLRIFTPYYGVGIRCMA